MYCILNTIGSKSKLKISNKKMTETYLTVCIDNKVPLWPAGIYIPACLYRSAV